MATCNEHGVYEADEIIELPRAVKGWRGGPVAEIRLANLGPHWIWATAYQMHGGDWSGKGSPLMDTPSDWAPTRRDAIEAAIAELRDHLAPRTEHCRDALYVIAWLDTITPNQLDLFGEAA